MFHVKRSVKLRVPFSGKMIMQRFPAVATSQHRKPENWFNWKRFLAG